MKAFIRYIISAVLIVIVQVLVLNRLSIGYGIYLMLPPLYILLLPFRMKFHYLLSLAFIIGLALDVCMNTYGLNASSLVLIAYLRPIIFRFISPSDEYMRGENTNMYASFSKFVIILFFTLLIYHIWYITLESFSVDGFLFSLIRIVMSWLASFILCTFFFLLFYKEKHLYQ